ncbi:hypothetical protein JTB14_018188 [Gonioctena quinquepunctata]|nr:hypothetical protein JTB14_018188 [Gonioctena quinquepunctata]
MFTWMSLENNMQKIKEENASLLKKYDEKVSSLENEIEELKSLECDLLAIINTKLEDLTTPQIRPENLEEVTAEAVDRMSRAENIIIRGIPESSGTPLECEEMDK